MKHSLIYLSPVVIAFTFSATAQKVTAPAEDAKAINRMIKVAQTPQEYRTIATYFHNEEAIFRSKSSEEKVEWQRRIALQSGPSMKWPTSAYSARNLYQYYDSKADEMATNAAHFDVLAAK